SQAAQFFDSVAQVREEASAEADAVELPTPESLPAALPDSSATLDSSFPLGYIPLADGSGMEFPARDYKSFLNNFLKYVEQFRKNMMKDFLAGLPRPVAYGKPVESPTSPAKTPGAAPAIVPDTSEPVAVTTDQSAIFPTGEDPA
ncbi:MAG TPA: hypothetical protein PKO06_16245, partial [Candidatus Ozemobacteraceae bacterium]|nr:hypothetical protein [Candidatus Ozemobacteraceae bacterium]